MKRYLASAWTKAGLALVLFGWGPLVGIILLSAIGLWPDPDPNPVGPGILFFLTAWPAIICLGIGVWRVRKRGTVMAGAPPARGATDGWRDWVRHPAVRGAAAIAGPVLIVRGAVGMQHDAGRGAVSALLLGAGAVHWALVGRMPLWLRRLK